MKMIETGQEFAEVFKSCNSKTGDIFIIATGKEPYAIYAAYGFNGRQINKVVGQDNWYAPRTAKRYIPSFYVTPRGSDTIYKCGLISKGGLFNSYIYQIKSSEILREGLKLLGARGSWINDIRYNFKHGIIYNGYGFKDPRPAFIVSFGLARWEFTEGLEDIQISKDLEIFQINPKIGKIYIDGVVKYFYTIPGNKYETFAGQLEIKDYSDFALPYTYKEEKSQYILEFPVVKEVRYPIEGDEDHSSWEYQIDPDIPSIIKVRQSVRFESYEKWLDYDIGGWSQAINSSNDPEGEWVTAYRYIYSDEWKEVNPQEFFNIKDELHLERLQEVLDILKYGSREAYNQAQREAYDRNIERREEAKETAVKNIVQGYKNFGYRNVTLNLK